LTEPLVRPMCLSDLPAVMEITRRSLPLPWSENVWREELASPLGLYLVLEVDGIVSGFIGLKLLSDEAHVMTIAVRPKHRRRGFARTLVETALDDPASADARRVHLEVRPSNVEARALYGSLGFVQAGRRPAYYGDEDALLMTLDLRRAAHRNSPRR
jgi:ribosomal-protein-alanine N-acetyltransferase